MSFNLDRYTNNSGTDSPFVEQKDEGLSRKEKERKLLEEIGSEKPGLSSHKKVAIGTAAGVIGATAVLVPTAKYFIDHQKHIITMKVQGTKYETYRLEVKKGSLVKNLKRMDITGYNFVGFYKDEKCTIPYLETDKVTKSSTVYCKYEPITYSVNYLTNQVGYVINADTTVEYGDKFIFTVTLLDRYDKSDIVVKVNGKVVESNKYDQYIVSFVEADLNITVENVVRNKQIIVLNIGAVECVMESFADVTIQDIIEENQDIIRESILFHCARNQSMYTEEQLQDLTLQDLLKVTTVGFYLEGHDNLLGKSEPINEIGDEVNIYTAFATLDKLIFGAENAVAAMEDTISGEVVIPSAWIDNGEVKDVTTIYKDAFYECELIEKVTLPDSITTIGINAFGCCIGLTEINLPNSIIIIDECAFGECISLTEIILPNSLKTIGMCAFFGLSNDVKEIIIPKSVTNIGIGPFVGCSGLEKITVEEGNSVYHSDNNCLIETETKTLIQGCKTSIIPDDGSVNIIGFAAFDGNTELVEITIPETITEIGSFAFEYCISLREITIPKSLKSVGEYAFGDSIGITRVNYTGDVNSWAEIDFESDEANPTYYSGNLYINNQLVTSANLNTATKVGKNTFVNLVDLTEVAIGNNVTSIGEEAFKLTGLTKIVIPNNVTSLGEGAFSCCEYLQTITIGSGVVSIGNYAFYECSNVKELNYNANVQELEHTYGDNNVFYNLGSNLKSCVVNINSQIIPNYLFCNAKGIIKVNFLGETISIGSSAFKYCTSLTEITIPDTVTNIGFAAFYWCSALEKVSLPNALTAIQNHTFYNCKALTEIEIPNNVTRIGSYAFYNCTNLLKVTLGDKSIMLEEMAFKGCENLTDVELGSTNGWIYEIYNGDLVMVNRIEISSSSQFANMLKSGEPWYISPDGEDYREHQ